MIIDEYKWISAWIQWITHIEAYVIITLLDILDDCCFLVLRMQRNKVSLENAFFIFLHTVSFLCPPFSSFELGQESTSVLAKMEMFSFFSNIQRSKQSMKM